MIDSRRLRSAMGRFGGEPLVFRSGAGRIAAEPVLAESRGW